MFPGTTTKLSEQVVASTTSISVTADLVRVTGSTPLATITPNFGGGFSGVCVLVPTDGTLTTVTTGNVAIAVIMPLNRATMFVYSKAANVWYPGAIS